MNDLIKIGAIAGIGYLLLKSIPQQETAVGGGTTIPYTILHNAPSKPSDYTTSYTYNINVEAPTFDISKQPEQPTPQTTEPVPTIQTNQVGTTTMTKKEKKAQETATQPDIEQPLFTDVYAGRKYYKYGYEDKTTKQSVYYEQPVVDTSLQYPSTPSSMLVSQMPTTKKEEKTYKAVDTVMTAVGLVNPVVGFTYGLFKLFKGGW